MRMSVNKAIGEVWLDIPDYMVSKEICADIPGFALTRNTGQRNTIIVGPGVTARKLQVSVNGHDNTVVIGSGANLAGYIGIKGSGNTVAIGAGTTFNAVKIYCKGKNVGVRIGRDCMFSEDVEIRTSDSHAVIDLDESRKINDVDGVYIGDHVWVSKGVLLQKGCVVCDDNIVGYGALVNSIFSLSNTRIVGIPAKALTSKRVSWTRKPDPDLEHINIYEWRSLPMF